MKARCLGMCVLLMAWLATGLAPARDYIEVNDPNFRPYPLAVPTFKNLGGAEQLAREGQEVLQFDLGMVGAFKLLDPKSFIADPAQEGLSAGAINFGDWINVGAEGLLKVGIFQSGTDLTLEGHLFAVHSGQEVLVKKYTGNVQGLRQMVHQLADAVFQHYTNSPSLFFTRIVFAKKTQQGSKEVCVMDFDGHGERCPVKNGSINLLPAWSADGQGIYFSSYMDGGPHLYLYDLVGNKNQAISKAPGLNIGAAASPDGKYVAATLSRDENSEIYRMDAGGGGLLRLTREWSIDSSPTWSPDAKQIAFVSERSGNPQIYKMAADGSNPTRLTFQGNYNQTPHWSPTGEWILFNARDERLVFDIFKIHAATGQIVRLTQDQGNNEHPTWSPDGNLVVFSSTRTGESKLYVMGADGRNQRMVSRGKGEYTTPEWGPWTKR